MDKAPAVANRLGHVGTWFRLTNDKGRKRYIFCFSIPSSDQTFFTKAEEIKLKLAICEMDLEENMKSRKSYSTCMGIFGRVSK